MAASRPVTTTRDLWHAAGRAAGDDRKRLVALLGVLWSVPVLYVGAFLTRLVGGGFERALADVARPLTYVGAPASTAYWADQDLALVGYLALQGVLLALLWGYYGGRLHRMAVIDLALGRKEPHRDAATFARRHWRSFVSARLAFLAGFAIPLAVATLLALTGRIDGWIGGVLVLGAAVAAIAAALVAVTIGAVGVMGGFLTGPVIAAEDSDTFDGVTRPFVYVAGNLPRLLRYRLLLGFGVVLGAGWRFAKTMVVLGLALGVLRFAAPDRLERALAILGAMGRPGDAERLGVGALDFVLAFVLVLAAAAMVLPWVADLVSRICCARSAVYLAIRRDTDGVPIDSLRGVLPVLPHQSAEEAGFVAVSRVGAEVLDA